MNPALFSASFKKKNPSREKFLYANTKKFIIFSPKKDVLIFQERKKVFLHFLRRNLFLYFGNYNKKNKKSPL